MTHQAMPGGCRYKPGSDDVLVCASKRLPLRCANGKPSQKPLQLAGRARQPGSRMPGGLPAKPHFRWLTWADTPDGSPRLRRTRGYGSGAGVGPRPKELESSALLGGTLANL